MAKHFTPRRQELCDWLNANGIDSNSVPVDADLTISTGPDGARRIHYEAVILNERGRMTLNERGDNPAIEQLSVPLIVDPPVWWQPHVKPTREQLLARAERVRALHRRNENTAECEYCSARDYPDYAVPFPCDTIRALGGEPTSAEQEEIKARWSKLYGNNQMAHPVVELHPTSEEADQ